MLAAHSAGAWGEPAPGSGAAAWGERRIGASQTGAPAWGEPRRLMELEWVAEQPERIRDWDLAAQRGLAGVMRGGFTAFAYCVFKNTLVMYFNGVVIRSHWAFPTPDSIRRNFTQPWKWEDSDGFKVNHLGHPIQGSVYFSAGRVSGFGFWGSAFFSALGSAMWEALHERQHASMNDFLITAPTGLSLGEILYRLYLQADAAGVPRFLTMLFNPAAGVHRIMTGWEPPQVQSNLYDLRLYLSAGYARTEYAYGGRAEESIAASFGAAGARIAYGDPFAQSTWVPFRSFEFLVSFGSNAYSHNDFRLFSDGFLFAFSPLQSGERSLSHGLSLHFDFASIGAFDMYYAVINMYSNALGWSAKYRRIFSPTAGWRARLHAAFTFFGATSYWHPIEETRLLNYGYGASLRHLSSFEFGRRNRIDVGNFVYFLWHIPGTADLSRGFVLQQFHDFSLSRLVTRSVSMGAAFSLATERGRFGEFPSSDKASWSVRTFVAWNGRSIRAAGGAY